MRLILADVIRHMPWRNDGGVTTEIAIASAGVTLDHLDQRMSTTQMDVTGPFSRFVNINRSLAVIAGDRLVVHHAEAGAATFVPDEAPTRFPDEANVYATLDTLPPSFDVMTRRDVWAYRVEAVALTAGERRSPPCLHTDMQWLVYCAHGMLLIGADDVPRGATAWLNAESDPDTVITRVGSVDYLVVLWSIG